MESNDITIMVLDIGNVHYSEFAKPIISDYAKKHGYRLEFITKIPDSIPIIDGAHPSWYKLLCHRIIDADFILCWDLDLLPVKNAPAIHKHIKSGVLNLAADSTIILGKNGKFENFRYNCGLIGVPRHESGFLNSVFVANVPGNLPSYEQYYVNDAICNSHKIVHELPPMFNAMYPPETHQTWIWDNAYFKHYTWGMPDHHRLTAISNHNLEYFS